VIAKEITGLGSCTSANDLPTNYTSRGSIIKVHSPCTAISGTAHSARNQEDWWEFISWNWNSQSARRPTEFHILFFSLPPIIMTTGIYIMKSQACEPFNLCYRINSNQRRNVEEMRGGHSARSGFDSSRLLIIMIETRTQNVYYVLACCRMLPEFLLWRLFTAYRQNSIDMIVDIRLLR